MKRKISVEKTLLTIGIIGCMVVMFTKVNADIKQLALFTWLILCLLHVSYKDRKRGKK